jgi:hypothetical protein
MRERLHAALVIARCQAFETLLAPGLYVTLALGLLLGFFLVNGFMASIDSSGFNSSLTPLYDVIARSLAGVFGTAFVAKLFAEGPFTFALLVSFTPVFLFLAISAVFRFGQEKSAGAVELLTYGPADGTSYFLGSFLKDVAFTAGALAMIALFFGTVAGLGNLILGPLFFVSLPMLFFISLATYACGILCSILTLNASAALAAFLGNLVLFLLVLGGSMALVSASVRTVASVAAATLQWISPFYYASLCVRAAQEGNAPGVLGGMALLFALALALLAIGHLVISRRGVRG